MTTAARTWAGLLTELLAGHDLTAEQTGWAMDQVMRGDAGDVQLAGFLVALRAKGETSQELTGLAEAMLSHAVPLSVPGPIVDLVGTGGDRAHTVNISTMGSLVLAGAGHRVVKHGNRAATSASGSADVLEALGVRLDLPPRRVGELAVEVGITFCFAQVFHPPCGTPPAPAAGSASPRPSTSSAPSRTRRAPGPRPSASPTAGSPRSWPTCWPPAAPRPSSSAATTASTS